MSDGHGGGHGAEHGGGHTEKEHGGGHGGGHEKANGGGHGGGHGGGGHGGGSETKDLAIGVGAVVLGPEVVRGIFSSLSSTADLGAFYAHDQIAGGVASATPGAEHVPGFEIITLGQIFGHIFDKAFGLAGKATAIV